MAKVFKDPLEVKEKVDGVWPWGFNAPTKDQAHSGNLQAGNYYGVGRTTPVGKEKASGLESGPIPQRCENYTCDEVINKHDNRG